MTTYCSDILTGATPKGRLWAAKGGTYLIKRVPMSVFGGIQVKIRVLAFLGILGLWVTIVPSRQMWSPDINFPTGLLMMSVISTLKYLNFCELLSCTSCTVKEKKDIKLSELPWSKLHNFQQYCHICVWQVKLRAFHKTFSASAIVLNTTWKLNWPAHRALTGFLGNGKIRVSSVIFFNLWRLKRMKKISLNMKIECEDCISSVKFSM